MFIDEAGNSLEPETLIPLSGILTPQDDTSNGAGLILAGDPKQLGAIVRSPLAEKYSLGRFIQGCSMPP